MPTEQLTYVQIADRLSTPRAPKLVSGAVFDAGTRDRQFA